MCLIRLATLFNIVWSPISLLLFVFSSFVTGSSLKSEKTTLQRGGISRWIHWLHDVAVNWSSTSHLSQEQDRLCSRSGDIILVKMCILSCWEPLLFRRRSCKVCNTRESRPKGVGENRSIVSLFAWLFDRDFLPGTSVDTKRFKIDSFVWSSNALRSSLSHFRFKYFQKFPVDCCPLVFSPSQAGVWSETC